MQINRMFEIVYLLLEHKIMTAHELAQQFEVSTRTIYRDVEMLSQAGIPIYMSKGKGGGISLMPEFVLNKAVLTEQEKKDILSSVWAVNAVNLSGESTAIQKLTSMLGKQSRDWVEVDFSSWGYFENDASFFEMLKNAILEKRVVTFLYASGKAERLSREVLPLKMVFKGASWYLYGFCRTREDYRFFKLRRMTVLTVRQEVFELEAPERVLQDVAMDRSGYIETRLRIAPQMSYRVYDEISSYQIAENGDFICTLWMPDSNVICDYAVSFGEYCTILFPPEAVEKMKKRIYKISQNYL